MINISIFRYIYRLLSIAKRKQVISFSLNDYVYKVAWGDGMLRLQTEFNALCDHSSIFDELAHFYKPVFMTDFFCVGRSLKLDSYISDSSCDRLVENLLKKMPEKLEYKEWDKTLKTTSLELIFNNISDASKFYIEEVLSGTKLPITGAHGDLIDSNLFFRDGRVYIIDWEFYRNYGSIISDFLRYYMMKRSRFNGVSFLSPDSLDIKYLPSSVLELVGFNSRYSSEMQLKVLGVVGNATAYWNESHGVEISRKIDLFIAGFMKCNMLEDNSIA